MTNLKADAEARRTVPDDIRLVSGVSSDPKPSDPHTSPEGLSEKTGAVAWRWHWNAGDEPDVWAYSETPVVSDKHRTAYPLYAHPPVPIGEEMVQRKSQIESLPVPDGVPLSPPSKEELIYAAEQAAHEYGCRLDAQDFAEARLALVHECACRRAAEVVAETDARNRSECQPPAVFADPNLPTGMVSDRAAIGQIAQIIDETDDTWTAAENILSYFAATGMVMVPRAKLDAARRYFREGGNLNSIAVLDEIESAILSASSPTLVGMDQKETPLRKHKS